MATLTAEQFRKMFPQANNEPVTGALATGLQAIADPLNQYRLPESMPAVGGMSAADFTGLTGAQGVLQDFSRGNLQSGDMRMFDLLGLGAGAAPAARTALKGGGLLGKEALRQMNEGTGLLGKVAINPRQYVVQKEPNILMSEFVPNVKSGEEMIVQHNLTPEKLIAAQKLGGMPVPSLAISKIKDPLTGYGDISLVGSKEMAIPSTKNPIYKSDAYTKRRPNIDYNIDYKSQENLKGLLSDVIDEVPSGESKFGSLVQEYDRKADNRLLKAKFLKDNNTLPDRKLFPDDYKYNAEIDRLSRENENQYMSWLNNFESILPEFGVNINARLFKGYSSSGNRKYAPLTLENVVKEMKGGANTEGWNYGVGNIRALVTPKFKNLKEITSNRDRIITSKDFDKIKDKFDAGYNDITSRLREINPVYDANDTMLEIAENKSFSILNDQYKNVPDSLKADIATYYDSLKSMPTGYFEIKPQRAVDIGEFKGAIVPENISQDAYNILTNAGIKDIYKYATPEQRKELFKKFGNQMFSAGAGLPLATTPYMDFNKK
ncbi:MAG TPA: hypothetical protein VIC51_07695 [Psychromonas sp.]